MLGPVSVRLVDEEGDLALLEREENEAVLLVDGVAAEALAEEHVPVWLPLLVHMFFDDLSNLNKIKIKICMLFEESNGLALEN